MTLPLGLIIAGCRLKMSRACNLSAILMIACTFAGCFDARQGERYEPDTIFNNPPTANVDEEDPLPHLSIYNSKLQLKDGGGKIVFTIKPSGDGFVMLDQSDQEMARFHLINNRLIVNAADGTELGEVTFLEDRFKIKTHRRSGCYWNLRRQADGNWKLEDQADRLLSKIKERGYGYEIEDPFESSLYKSKLKAGKCTLRDSADEIHYYTKDNATPLAMACLGFDVLEPLHVKAALMTMVRQFGHQ